MIEKITDAFANIHRVVKTDEDLEWNRAVWRCTEIVQEVAKEEKEDIDWKSTREYVEERYFKPIMELSEKYDYPCKDIALDFDWVFGLIKKIENCLSKDGGWIPCSERLPEKLTNALVSLDDNDYTLAWYSEKDKQWRSSFTDSVITSSVVAWQTIPAPYHQKGE